MKRAFRPFITLICLSALISTFSSALEPSRTLAGPAAFSAESLPSDVAGMLVPSSMTSYAVSSDGQTIYAVDNSSTSPGIWKSTNGGSTFTKTVFTSGTFGTPVPTALPKATLIAVAPDDPNTVAFVSNGDVAGSAVSTVWASTNGGTTFWSLTNTTGAPSPVPGWTGAGAVINTVDISALSAGVHFIAVGGIKSAGVEGLSYYNFGWAVPSWTDATGGLWTPPTVAVTSVKAFAFSPNFPSDRTFVAVTESAAGVYLESANMNNTKWDAAAGFTGFNGTTNLISATGGSPVRGASIVLAPTYFGSDPTTRIAFVGIAASVAAGAGSGVYRFNDATPTLISSQNGIKSVDYNGTELVAGEYDSNAVWSSTDMLSSTPTFNGSVQIQSPSGSNAVSQTMVAWAGPNVVATTTGPESAFSLSKDNGVTFNDVSLVRTTINNIEDFAVPQNGTQWYLITDNGANLSVWRNNGGWDRVLALSSTAAGGKPFIIRLAPENSAVVYIAQLGGHIIYFSNDGGETNWSARYAGISGATIKDLAVENATTLYYITSAGRISKSTNGGFIWSNEIPAGTLAGGNACYSLGTNQLLVAGTDGNFAYSVDGGSIWTTSAVPVPGATNIQLAATGLTSGNYLYAITDKPSDFVYRWQIGTSSAWDKITPALPSLPTPAGVTSYKSIVLNNDGTLYVSTSAPYIANSQVDSTVWRTPNPDSAPSAVVWAQIPAGGNPANPVVFTGDMASSAVSGVTKIWTTTLAIPAGGSVANALAPRVVSLLDAPNVPSAPTLTNLLTTVNSMGLQQGIANSLVSKLQNAKDAQEAKNAAQRRDVRNKLQAFVNFCEAQTGKGLTAEQAATLISQANLIMSQLQQ